MTVAKPQQESLAGTIADRATVATQQEFAAHMRDPEVNPAPRNLEARRLKVYHELVYNNIEGFISSGFPVLRKLYADADWHAMVRAFVRQHRSRTPYFTELSREFIEYLEHEHQQRSCDGPFLLELARYEWAEQALFVADAELPPAGQPPSPATILESIPSLSPLAWPMVFTYPVHEIGPSNQPAEPAAEPVCLVVYRNRENSVKFLAVNTVTARLLELCETNRHSSASELLSQIAAEMNHPNPAAVLEGGKDMLAQLHNLDIIL